MYKLDPLSLRDILLTVERRRALAKSAPPCPRCELAKNTPSQVQLRAWINPPALWRCRTCRHEWTHEPEQ